MHYTTFNIGFNRLIYKTFYCNFTDLEHFDFRAITLQAFYETTINTSMQTAKFHCGLAKITFLHTSQHLHAHSHI